MNINGFSKGELKCDIRKAVSAEELSKMLAGEWRDGYVAFANGEKRIAELAGIPLDATFLTQRINGRISGIEGYVTELNLWRINGQVVEEIAAEREENSFYLQHFTLETKPETGGNCWHRDADTRPGSHHKGGRHLFRDKLSSVEVVWPEKRMNIFITRGA